MKKIEVSKTRRELIDYHKNLLKMNISTNKLYNLDYPSMSFYNNEDYTIRIITCPYFSGRGGVVHIFKSTKDDIGNYILIRTIYCSDEGRFGWSVDASLDINEQYKNILVISSLGKGIYIYQNIFQREHPLVNIIKREEVTSIDLSNRIFGTKVILNKDELIVETREIYTDNIINIIYKLNIFIDNITYSLKE